MAQKILVVDDERNIVDIVKYNLEKDGFEVISAPDGEAGVAAARSQSPDLILLDIMMPKMDGFEACKKIREFAQTPIIMLTARAEEIDKVLGFELGADDYVTKPFGIRELMARIKANLRRKSGDESPVAGQNVQVFGDISFDFDMYEVKRKGEIVDLTRREFELLKFLATQKNYVFTREQLLEKVWGYEYFGDVRTVDVTIRRLRTKLELNPEAPEYIMTRRGVGYYFNTL